MPDLADVRVDLTGIGSVIARATAAKSGTTVTADVNGKVVTVQVARDLSVSTGDMILVQRVGSRWVAVARLYASAPASQYNQATPDPKPSSVSGTTVFAPVETRSYRPSGWRDDNTSVYQGDYGGWGNHKGCAFYGDGPKSLSGATITKAWVQLRRLTGGTYASQTTTLWLVTQSTRPGGAPTLSSSTTGPALAVGTDGTFSVPTSWVTSMAAGTAGGLGLYVAGGTPYTRYAGRGDWSPAWTMTVEWTR
jgi:hypothetical protein